MFIVFEYLAEIVDPGYTIFKDTTIHCQQLVLDVWDVEKTTDIEAINIFAADLEILSAGIDPDGFVRVCCAGSFSCPGAFLLWLCAIDLYCGARSTTFS